MIKREMAALQSSVSIIYPNSIPSSSSHRPEAKSRVNVSSQRRNSSFGSELHGIRGGRRRRLAKLITAGNFAEIEPDLNEDPIDRWETNSISAEDFKYGYYDGAHTYYEGEAEKGSVWGAIADDIAAVDPPTGFQGLISWLFLPAIAAGMFYNVPHEYLFIGAGVFTCVFSVIEMDKPDKPHNFEPQIYNMERRARDKLINDYNTMTIWDFNDKYGDVWDFTVKKGTDDIMKR